MVDLFSLISSGVAFFVVAISPGPANISNAAIAMNYGWDNSEHAKKSNGDTSVRRPISPAYLDSGLYGKRNLEEYRYSPFCVEIGDRNVDRLEVGREMELGLDRGMLVLKDI